MPTDQLVSALEPRAAILARFTDLRYPYVPVALAGFRSGSGTLFTREARIQGALVQHNIFRCCRRSRGALLTVRSSAG